jgi:hypothetical protein
VISGAAREARSERAAGAHPTPEHDPVYGLALLSPDREPAQVPSVAEFPDLLDVCLKPLDVRLSSRSGGSNSSREALPALCAASDKRARGFYR